MSQWLELGELTELTKDTDLYPNWSSAVATQAHDESIGLAQSVILDGDARFETLMTTRQTSAAGELAGLYGVPTGKELPEERAGLLARVAFLAAHAHPTDGSIVHRGKFVRERVLCQDLPLPPAGIDMSDPNRLTNPSCKGCHQGMDPVGEGFDQFDAVGQFSQAGFTPDIAGGEVMSSPDESDVGPSVDQLIASSLGVDALVAGVRSGGSSGNGRISYLAKSQPAHPVEDPAKLFESWFKAQALPKNELDEYKAKRKSVLDLVAGDLSSLKTRLPKSDWHKVDQHLTAISALEQSVGQLANTTCSNTAPSGGYSFSAHKDVPVTTRKQIDVIVQALSCNLTRVATLQVGHTGGAGGQDQPNWPDEGVTSDLTEHNLAHEYGKGSAAHKSQREALEIFYYRQFAYLLAQLEAIPEGAGTLLDNTLVLWTKHLGSGHSTNSMLFMLAGGGLKTNRFISRPDKPHNDLLTSVCHQMGVTEVTKFGDPEFCNGPLSL